MANKYPANNLNLPQFSSTSSQAQPAFTPIMSQWPMAGFPMVPPNRYAYPGWNINAVYNQSQLTPTGQPHPYPYPQSFAPQLTPQQFSPAYNSGFRLPNQPFAWNSPGTLRPPNYVPEAAAAAASFDKFQKNSNDVQYQQRSARKNYAKEHNSGGHSDDHFKSQRTSRHSKTESNYSSNFSRGKNRFRPYQKDSLSSNSYKEKCKQRKSQFRENSASDSKKEQSILAKKEEPSIDVEAIFNKKYKWIRCSPAELYYEPKKDNSECVIGTDKLLELKKKFRYDLVERGDRIKSSKTPFQFPPRKVKIPTLKSHNSDDDTSCDEEDESASEDDCEDSAYEELQRKKMHPWRLHDELWYNDPGEMNDGPLCRCSVKARKTGIRHGIYPGEEHLERCDMNSNNRERLYHYKIAITPFTNFLSKFPTTITHDGHEFIFEGFSLLSHFPLSNLPPCKVIRFNIEYTISLIEEKFPTNFTVEDLDLFTSFIFNELLELVDLNWYAYEDEEGCRRFHLLPRFSRLLDDDGKELLSLNFILQYLLNFNNLIMPPDRLDSVKSMTNEEWMDFAKKIKGMIVTYPGMKPSSLRVDQIDREKDEKVDGSSVKTQQEDSSNDYPVIVHFGIRPPQLSYAGNPKYQKAWRDYVKFRHLLANKPKVSFVDRQTLLQKEEKLQEMRMKSDLKRDVTVVINSKSFYTTGIQCDIVQHALIIPVLVCHLRFHQSLEYLEKIIGHQFQDKFLLQLALTHPSYRENFGTNPDHTRNSLTNCGIRQPQYGDRRVHFMNTRKRGINMLINIMSRFGCSEETASNINHNERLEFLGDAVVEFLSSIHLYFMFPDLEEGGLATYRAAIVQNQHLAVLAKKLQLDKFMLYAHGSDLCHDLELRHAMANCFEALMGALFLDGGIEVADRIFSNTLFGDDTDLLDVWVNYNPHPIQQQEPDGDRHYIDSIPRLKELTKFEEVTGIDFTHIRLLARAFTHRSVGYNNLTLGSNQRMEFLGDTVLQLVASEYLYKFFPEHHEGHLSLLRSSLVNNKTQAVVCDDLGMTQIAIYNYAKGELKTKDRADLLEAFLGALYVDKGLTYCRVFCEVCFFPRLEDFIMNQDWNDPKSKLQQCCLTLRSVDGGEPDIPIYKVIECLGPTNTRVYVVAVYFRDQRLATGQGHSIQEAEMNAASNALESSKELFPQLNHQRKVIERSVKIVKQTPEKRKKC